MASPSNISTTTPRAAALEALTGILDRGKTLEAAIESIGGFAGLEPRDRAFARLLVATTLRRRGELDTLIRACVDRPLPRAARAVHHILALGIVQIIFLKTPHHAAVDTAVELAGKVARGRYRGLANAVLRRITRDGESLAAGLDGPRLNTPDWLWQGWEQAFGAETCRRIAEAHMAEPPLDFTLRDPADLDKYAAALGAEKLPTGSLRRATGGAIRDLEGYDEGAWWIQDLAAALPSLLLGDIRERRVVDLCAAPGGKTLQLAAAGGLVTAIDSSAERLKLVEENLKRTGLTATCIHADARKFSPDAPFDGVLLDAPCSATGTLRRHPDIAHIKSARDAEKLIPVQDALLARAAQLTAPGGRLVYAACSLDPREGEDRITAFLEAHSDFAMLPIEPGEFGIQPDWVTPAGALRTLPCQLSEQGGMDGFYAARLQRHGEAAR